MSFFLAFLATIVVLISSVISVKSNQDPSVTKWLISGMILTILMVWGQVYNQFHESKKVERKYLRESEITERNHQELKDLHDPVQKLARSLHPTLDDNAALILLLDEIKKSFEQSRRGGTEWVMGMPVAVPTSPDDPILVSELRGLLGHREPSVREAAKTCLEFIRSGKQ